MLQFESTGSVLICVGGAPVLWPLSAGVFTGAAAHKEKSARESAARQGTKRTWKLVSVRDGTRTGSVACANLCRYCCFELRFFHERDPSELTERPREFVVYPFRNRLVLSEPLFGELDLRLEGLDLFHGADDGVRAVLPLLPSDRGRAGQESGQGNVEVGEELVFFRLRNRTGIPSV